MGQGHHGEARGRAQWEVTGIVCKKFLILRVAIARMCVSEGLASGLEGEYALHRTQDGLTTMGRKIARTPTTPPSADDIRNFFARSDVLDCMVLRPLSHITMNWEASWDPVAHRYEPESGSFADDLNAVIELIATTAPPDRYHDNEDRLAERVVRDLGWPIQKRGTRWVGADYATILEQGAFRDMRQRDLIAAAAGRVRSAFAHGHRHIDEMEDGHRTMLTAFMAIIIYHRYCDGTALFVEPDEEPT